jgi:hypothetical protein
MDDDDEAAKKAALRCPAGLGNAGRKLFRDLNTPLVEEGWCLSASDRQLLTQAAQLQDRLVAIEKILADSDLMTTGYKGQPVPHPLINESRQTHAAIAQLIGRISWEMDDDEDGDTVFTVSAGPRSVQARKAANARWKNRN